LYHKQIFFNKIKSYPNIKLHQYLKLSKRVISKQIGIKL
jgi:hypothetical protein